MSHLSGLFIEHHSDNQSHYSSSLSHHQSGFPRTRPIQREWSAREPAFCGVRKLQWVPISNKTSKALENNKKILSYYSHVILIICCSRERRSCIAFVQIHFAMNTLVKKKVFIILLHYYPSPSGLWRVGRVHLLGEHRSRLFRSSSRSSCCYLLHLWHRKLSLVLFRNKSLV